MVSDVRTPATILKDVYQAIAGREALKVTVIDNAVRTPLYVAAIDETRVPYVTKWATVSTAVVAITAVAFGWAATDVNNAEVAYLSASQPVTFTWWIGVNPTATIGHPLTSDGIICVRGNAKIQRLRFIRRSTTDAVVTITLERLP